MAARELMHPEQLLAQITTQSCLIDRLSVELTSFAARRAVVDDEARKASGAVWVRQVFLRAVRRSGGCPFRDGLALRCLSELLRAKRTSHAWKKLLRGYHAVIRRRRTDLFKARKALVRMERTWREDFALTPPRPNRG